MNELNVRYCEDHGLYDGRDDCPRCGVVGVEAVLDEDGDWEPDYPDRVEETESER